MTNRPLRVFLCHSSNDKPAVRELYQKLRAEAWIEPWLDEEELYPGQDWDLEIEKAVKLSDVVLVCLSNNSINKKGYVQKELRFALDTALEMPEETIFIIPVRLEECTPPRSLRGWQYADYFPETQREYSFQRLLISLKKQAKLKGLTIEEESIILMYEGVKLVPVKKEKTNPIQDTKLSNKIILFNSIEFMLIPAGKFIMGSNNYDNDEKTQHTVNIPFDYWMARFPVTNELYNAYMKSININQPVLNWEKKKRNPITNVTWIDANGYCKWLSQLLTSEIPHGLVIRLPTEAEWEKAARGIDGREYPWGNTFDENKCNSNEGGKGDTTRVGLYSPQGDSPYGCADMSGNVWEWTHSLYKSYPYKINDGREDEKDNISKRVLRGGSYFSGFRDVRCAKHGWHVPINKNDIIGFRMVLAPSLS